MSFFIESGLSIPFDGQKRLPKFDQDKIKGKSAFDHLINKGDPTGNEYVFLVHPRDIFDELACIRLAGADPSFLARFIPSRLEQELKNRFLYTSLAKMEPFLVRNGEVTVSGQDERANLMAVLLYGEQMMSNGWRRFAQSRIIDAIIQAKEGGAKLVGLGAYTSPATLGGKLLRNPDNEKTAQIRDIGITNGNSFTAAISVESIKDWTQKLNLKAENTKVGVVGATGSVGTAVSNLLIEDGYRPMLNGRTMGKLVDKFSGTLGDSVSYSDQLADLTECDIVLVATSGAESTILPEHIAGGTVVVEDTQPRNIKGATAAMIRHNGGLPVDGGYVHIPGYKCGFPLRLPKETAFACFAEGFILTMEGRFGDYSIGDAEVEKAREMMVLARKYHIEPAIPTWEADPINPDDIKRTLHLNAQRRRSQFSLV